MSAPRFASYTYILQRLYMFYMHKTEKKAQEINKIRLSEMRWTERVVCTGARFNRHSYHNHFIYIYYMCYDVIPIAKRISRRVCTAVTTL